jgi:hypothetical protein
MKLSPSIVQGTIVEFIYANGKRGKGRVISATFYTVERSWRYKLVSQSGGLIRRWEEELFTI